MRGAYKQGTTTLGTLTYTYDAAGNRIKTGGTFARSNIPPVLTTSYNANNQQTVFGASTETYDLNGNLATFTDASGTTTYSWNARNQLTTITGPGLTSSFTYDSFQRKGVVQRKGVGSLFLTGPHGIRSTVQHATPSTPCGGRPRLSRPEPSRGTAAAL